MTTDAGSTVPRRQLGRHLRQLREDAQVTVKAAADALEWSTPKIWRIESGAVSMRALDVEAMCRVYGASPELTQALMGLAKETRARGWWQSYGDAIPKWFEVYVGLETASSRLRKYEPELIPGLLQTEEYATEVFRVCNPEMPEAEIERGVAVRLSRQALLTRRLPPAPQVDIVLGEGALGRSTEDSAAMAKQLDRLVEAAAQPNVSVLVLRFSAGVHRAMNCGSFTILDFPSNGGRPAEPSTVYSDGPTGALYLDKPAEVDAYEEIWDGICMASLDPAESRDLITTIAREYESS